MCLKGEYCGWHNALMYQSGPTKWDSPGRVGRNQEQVEEKDDPEDEPVEDEPHPRDHMSNVRREDGCRYEGILPAFGAS